MLLLCLICFLIALCGPCLSYVDIGQTPNSKEFHPGRPVPPVYRAPVDLTFSAAPLITALAQARLLRGNETCATIYSIGYSASLTEGKKGRAIFARGVFASDAPGGTCSPCGNQASHVRANATSSSASLSCSSPYYQGVFRSSVAGSSRDVPAPCMPPIYSGVLSPIPTRTVLSSAELKQL